MKKLSLIFIFLFIASFVILTSCRDEATTIGGKWLQSDFNNLQTDTCTVLLSTVLSDSLATSADSVCEIGHYKDAIRGDIKTSFYTEYNVTIGSTNPLANDNRYRFDSLTIRLYPDSDYLGDTLTGPQKIYIHQLKKNIEMDDYGYLYNRSNVAYDPTPLTSFTYTPHPCQRAKKVEVRLPDELGLDWFTRMRKSEDRLEQQTYFRDYFKGLTFKSDDNNTIINGFQVNDSSFVITMYYHDITNLPTAKEIKFTPSSSHNFQKVEFDRTGTPLAQLKPGINNGLSSTKTNHIAYLQGLTGMYILVDFPHLNDLNAEGQMVSIESAYLQLYPVKTSYGPANPLPPKLLLYTTDVNGVTGDVIYNLAGTSVQTGSLVTDLATRTDTYYTFDVSTFMRGIFGTTGTSRKKLKIILPDGDFFNSTKGLLLGDMKYSTNNTVKLTLVYKTYNEQK